MPACSETNCKCKDWVQNDDPDKRNECNNCGHSSQKHTG